MTDAQQEVRSAVQWWVVVVMAGQDYWAGLHGWLDRTRGKVSVMRAECTATRLWLDRTTGQGWTGLEGRFL